MAVSDRVDRSLEHEIEDLYNSIIYAHESVDLCHNILSSAEHKSSAPSNASRSNRVNISTPKSIQKPRRSSSTKDDSLYLEKVVDRLHKAVKRISELEEELDVAKNNQVGHKKADRVSKADWDWANDKIESLESELRELKQSQPQNQSRPGGSQSREVQRLKHDISSTQKVLKDVQNRCEQAVRDRDLAQLRQRQLEDDVHRLTMAVEESQVNSDRAGARMEAARKSLPLLQKLVTKSRASVMESRQKDVQSSPVQVDRVLRDLQGWQTDLTAFRAEDHALKNIADDVSVILNSYGKLFSRYLKVKSEAQQSRESLYAAQADADAAAIEAAEALQTAERTKSELKRALSRQQSDFDLAQADLGSTTRDLARSPSLADGDLYHDAMNALLKANGEIRRITAERDAAEASLRVISLSNVNLAADATTNASRTATGLGTSTNAVAMNGLYPLNTDALHMTLPLGPASGAAHMGTQRQDTARTVDEVPGLSQSELVSSPRLDAKGKEPDTQDRGKARRNPLKHKGN
eukprot:Clim_evm28s215 gene=Clim_evmTU28s215